MANKGDGPYISDPKLVPRIKSFLSSKDPNSTVLPGSVVDHLQATYSRDYARKKRNALFQCVVKALPMVKREVFGTDEKPAHKKRRYSSSSDSDPETLVAYENTNALNLAMRNLYKMKNAAKASASQTPDSKDASKTALSTTPLNSNSTPSTPTPDQQKKSKPKKSKGTSLSVPTSGGWVVDRKGSHSTDSVQKSEDTEPGQEEASADKVDTSQAHDNPSDMNYSFTFSCTCGAARNVNISHSPKTTSADVVDTSQANNNPGNMNYSLTIACSCGATKTVSVGGGGAQKTVSGQTVNGSHEVRASVTAHTASVSGKGDRAISRAVKAVMDADSDVMANSDGNSSSSAMKKKKKRKTSKRTEIGDLDTDLPDIEAAVPEKTLNDFAGSDKLLREIHEDLDEFRYADFCRFAWLSDKRICRNYLLYGPRGSGKSYLAECMAGHLKLPLLKPRINTLISGVSGNSEQRIRDLFEQAADQAPCVLFLEDIECVAPRQDTPGVSKDMMTRTASELGTCIDELRQRPEKVMLIATTSKLESVSKDLRIPGRFIEKGLGMPDEKSRESMQRMFCEKYVLSPDLSLKTLAKLTPGFVADDLRALVDSAVSVAFRRVRNLYKPSSEESDTVKYPPPSEPPAHLTGSSIECTEQDKTAMALTEDDFRIALKKAQPAAKREGFVTVPMTTWENVGALENVRTQLQDSILCRIHDPERTRAFGLSMNSGIILVGPPGCGKTLVAKAMANEAGLNFMYIKGPELLDKYVGESEKKLRETFDRAQACAPCLIFFDEMDTLCTNRQHSEGSNVGKSVTNQLLALMDGCDERNQVYVMGATNRIEQVDPALQRPGRFDKNIYVGLPDERGRLEILKALIKGGSKCRLVSCDLAHFAQETEGFSGADLKQLVQEAATISMKESMHSNSEDIYVLTGEHFSSALQHVKPSVLKKDAEKYLRVAQRI